MASEKLLLWMLTVVHTLLRGHESWPLTAGCSSKTGRISGVTGVEISLGALVISARPFCCCMSPYARCRRSNDCSLCPTSTRLTSNRVSLCKLFNFKAHLQRNLCIILMCQHQLHRRSPDFRSLQTTSKKTDSVVRQPCYFDAKWPTCCRTNKSQVKLTPVV